MTLYFIADDSDPDFNKDLFVRANDTDAALKFWRKYFNLPRDENPDQMFEVPSQDGVAGALKWHEDVNVPRSSPEPFPVAPGLDYHATGCRCAACIADENRRVPS